MRKKTKEEFIQEAINVHGNNYDYSKVNYINTHTNIEIYCNKCQQYFWQIPKHHLHGHGCPICARKKLSVYQSILLDEFIERAKFVHGDEYDYSQVMYVNIRTPVKIWCKRCKKFFNQIPNHHFKGSGCPYCYYKKIRKTKNDFIKEANKIHNFKYNYDKAKYINNRTKIKIYCNTCKKTFLQSPSSHLQGQGCPHCTQSKGENKIQNLLVQNNILYETQKRFKDCRDKLPLPFDFYLPDYNICIEYQGQQHYNNGKHFFTQVYKSKEKGIKAYNKQKLHDKIKKEYCKNNNIKLIEIKYNENIEEKLKNFLNF